ncbi:MAG: LLM class flavin-dependent oxidoreductase [Candidatus Obscuribacterales bacterium]|nr:LLM class flavin-dependent oxidoreductase [Candidatus Obscuribacterales bacterium]
MRFGIFSVVDHYPVELNRSCSDFYKELLDQSQLADELGFYSFWIAEHHFHEYGIIPRPALFLAAAASRTKRIRLGSAVAVLPLDDPIRTAEDYAMLDLISNGRLEFGVGSGYLQHEFDGFSIPIEERRERFDEALSIIRMSWQGERFSFKGSHFEIANLCLNVLPVQKPEPPIFIAVLRNEAAVFVARQKLGMMMIPYASTEKLEELEITCQCYKTELMNICTDDSFEARIQFGLHVFCADSTEEARAIAKPYIERYTRSRLYAKKRSFEELIEKDLIAVGDPEEIIRVASRYKKAGMTDFLLLLNFGGMPHQLVENSMRRIAGFVLPAFRQ